MSWVTWPVVGVDHNQLECPSCGTLVELNYAGLMEARAHRCELTPEEEQELLR